MLGECGGPDYRVQSVIQFEAMTVKGLNQPVTDEKMNDVTPQPT